MITEDYVSFETAKLLKEKGFNGDCEHFYEVSPEDGILRVCGTDCHDNTKYDFEFSRPTLQMAMKWLREEKYIHIMVDCIGSKNYLPTIQITNDGCDYVVEGEYNKLGANGFDTYEQACEAAIIYCCKNNLLKING